MRARGKTGGVLMPRLLLAEALCGLDRGPVEFILALASGLWKYRGLFVWAVDALKEWHDFYVLVGTAGATLLALLFVAASLGAGFLTDERQSATDTFMSPVVVHFTTVFFLSAAALCPWHQARFFAALIGVTALVGAILSTTITVRVVRTNMTNYLEDYLAYGLLPGFGYLALLAAAVSIYLQEDFGLDTLAGALLLLAIVNIRNAWDLTLTMVRRSRRGD
jgi:hypothetical protein